MKPDQIPGAGATRDHDVESSPAHTRLSVIAAIADEGVPLLSADIQAEIIGAVEGPTNAQIEAALQRAQTSARTVNAGAQVAVIPLQGVITPRGSWIARLFGISSGLEGFRRDVRNALADDEIDAIVLDIDSPGGRVDLVAETAAELRASRGKKKIVAVCNTMCASAAYWIAAQADEIVITPSGQAGSIGVIQIHEDISTLAERMGITVTVLSAGRYKAEGTQFEPLSQTARQAMQSKIDAFYNLFVSDVAAGRGKPVQAVTAGFGQGRCVTAEDAVLLGLADRVATLEEAIAALGSTAGDDPEEDEGLPDPGDGDESDGDDDDDVGASAPEPGDENSEAESAPSAHPSLLYGEDRLEQPPWHL